MTQSEAIKKHKKLKILAEGTNDKRGAFYSAEEHEQLAEWLEELKTYRECNVCEYNKAIDDLIAKCENEKFAESDEISLSDVHTGVNSGLSMAIHFAEQLKAGVKNES